ncbi:MAG: hypothetical protein A2649_03155 [Candidatus Yanofskybacteria bacterium RIFCSPHIGHO2_01_FULL_41_26]|uniref:Uncharacterized protein n=1 Tax=Candidatus Yanofskybacteria bacterium RIFCSPHIGHO2_01_FULL_41_26 TaxID=1802661 RepID=A0A1F8EBT5_9BACT|nr:MAG: hypothetical protein A2649_03155 [Candidatus Yanofskybacteria bacterium RIFCSPHIGHO2_01_FULL_41_26]
MLNVAIHEGGTAMTGVSKLQGTRGEVHSFQTSRKVFNASIILVNGGKTVNISKFQISNAD